MLTAIEQGVEARYQRLLAEEQVEGLGRIDWLRGRPSGVASALLVRMLARMRA